MVDRGMVDRGMMDRGMVDWSMMDWGMVHRGMVNRGMMDRNMVGRSIGNSIILDISHISTVVVSMIVDMLGPAIRKEDRVGSLYITRTISNLASIEVGSRILIMHSILIAVRFRLLLVHWCMVRDRCMVRCRCLVRGCRHVVSWGVVRS